MQKAVNTESSTSSLLSPLFRCYMFCTKTQSDQSKYLQCSLSCLKMVANYVDHQLKAGTLGVHGSR